MLSPTQRAMIAELRHGDIVPTERIVEKVYGSRADGGPDHAEAAIRRQMYKLRQKLTPVGVEIETVGVGRGSDGYRLRPEHVPLLATLGT